MRVIQTVYPLSSTGNYQGIWRLESNEGELFGPGFNLGFEVVSPIGMNFFHDVIADLLGLQNGNIFRMKIQ